MLYVYIIVNSDETKFVYMYIHVYMYVNKPDRLLGPQVAWGPGTCE